jgi:hypothetical protein
MGGSEETNPEFSNGQPPVRDFDDELRNMLDDEEFPDVFAELNQVFDTKAAANIASPAPETRAFARQQFIHYFTGLNPGYDHAAYTRALEEYVDPDITDDEYCAIAPDDLEINRQLDIFIQEILDPQTVLAGQETSQQSDHFARLKLAYAADLWFTYDEHSLWLVKMLDVIRPKEPVVTIMDRVELEAATFLELGRSSSQIRYFGRLNEIMAQHFSQVLGTQLAQSTPEIGDTERLEDVIILVGTVEGMRQWEQARVNAGKLVLSENAVQSIERYDNFRFCEAQRHTVELAEGAGLQPTDLAERIRPFITAVSMFAEKAFRLDFAGSADSTALEDDPDFQAWYGDNEDD